MVAEFFKKEKKALFKKLFFLSFLCNIFLMALAVYLQFFADPVHLYIDKEVPQELECENKHLIKSFNQLSFEQLLSRLDEKRWLTSLYSERDVILGYLVSKKSFNLDAALGHKVYPQKRLRMDDQTIEMFLDLTEEDFKNIKRYISTEKWPLTPHGLFNAIKNGSKDPYLLRALCFTPQFLAVEALFTNADILIKKKDLIDLMIEGSFETLNAFLQENKGLFSQDVRRSLLLQQINEQSKTALWLLIATDSLFAQSHLNEETVCLVFQLFEEQTLEIALFAQQLLTTSKSEQIYAAVSKWLGKYYAKEKLNVPPLAAIPRTINKQYDFHVIQSGESLWGIAKKYDISLELLVKINHLKGNTIYPGKTLKVTKK